VSKEYALRAAIAHRVLTLQPIPADAERNWSAEGRQFPASRAVMAVLIGKKYCLRPTMGTVRESSL
jgi:hypothetical protein